ncbi:scavenger receptor class F member 1-like isoform X2 [Haliotis rubra]|nr:scavenger receptor class F member 1-like isoform X2 [Haliotis rubra]XP_046568438.1 scavenger receptor class F member 1-like isoform X2 [Haliotis rubra]
MWHEKNAVVLSATMWLGAVLVLISSQVCGQTNCDWGKYGENCDKACPEHCIFNKDRNLQHCHKITGKCSEGCMHGWHGNQCNHPCSSHCRNNICNQQNGFCAFGCDRSYTGDFCNMTKSTVLTTHATFPTTEASPSEPATDLLAIIIPIIVIIILCLVAVVICVVDRMYLCEPGTFHSPGGRANH